MRSGGRFPNVHRVLVLVLSLLGAITSLAPAPLYARAEITGTFRLQGGHEQRRELAFTVIRPTTLRIRVASDRRTPIAVSILAGGRVVTTTRFDGSGETPFSISPELASTAREWVVSLAPYETGADASGTIRISGLDDARVRSDHVLDRWLADTPAVAAHLTWRDETGTQTYSRWPVSMRQRLWSLFDAAMRRQFDDPSEPPPNVWRSDDDADVTTAFTPEDARELYLRTVAQSLAVEIDRRVLWSVRDLNEQELDTLFSSNALFWWHAERRVYRIVPGSHGWAVPAPATIAYQFLDAHKLVGRTRRATIVNLLEWTRGLSHFAGPTSVSNFTDFWGYRGGMPVVRALEGTRYAGTELRGYPQYDQVRHYTAGCHGTVGLFANLLRSVNIPVQYRAVSNETSSHATALFQSEDLALTHGDDPYSQTSVGARAEEILIDRATYDRWMGPLAEDAGRSIGRQPTVLALRYLPPFVRELHARDRADGRTREASRVFDMFRSIYSLRELEQARLWERLDRQP